MDFQEVVRRRKMVRSFLDRPLPEGAVDRILANAQRAPSAGSGIPHNWIAASWRPPIS